jgi:hypothetical protein
MIYGVSAMGSETLTEKGTAAETNWGKTRSKIADLIQVLGCAS